MTIGSGFLGTLLKKAIQDGKLKVPPNHDIEQTIQNLSLKATKRKAIANFIKGCRKSGDIYLEQWGQTKCDQNSREILKEWLTNEYYEEFMHLDLDEDGNPKFNIIGCNSTCSDIDVVVMAHNVQNPIYPGEEQKLIDYMKNQTEMVQCETFHMRWYGYIYLILGMIVRCLMYVNSNSYYQYITVLNSCIVIMTVLHFGKIIKLCVISVDNIEEPLYDMSKEIDICYMSKVNGTFQTKKGGPETVNIIYHTYGLHPQVYPPLVKRCELVEIEPYEKLGGLSKFILDKAEEMLGTEKYLGFRQQKIDSYHAGPKRYELTFNMLPHFRRDVTSPDWNPAFWKSFTMKVVQTYLCSIDNQYHVKSESYCKPKMAMIFGDHYNDHSDDIYNLLTYKIDESTEFPEGSFQLLCQLYEEMYNTYYPKMPDTFEELYDNIAEIEGHQLCNVTQLRDDIFHEFVKSPYEPTTKFIKMWEETYGRCSLSSLFVEPNTGLEILDEFPTLKNRVLRMPQRSQDWMEAYHNVYKCGRSGGLRHIPEDFPFDLWLKRQYNLIMGCIGELLLEKYIDWEDFLQEKYTKTTVGMIVESLVPESVGYCPDMILVTESNEIIPVEYKTIYSDSEPTVNNCFLEKYYIARKQLKGAVGVINHNSDIPLARRGIVAYMYIFKDKTEGRYIYRVYLDQFVFKENELYLSYH